KRGFNGRAPALLAVGRVDACQRAIARRRVDGVTDQRRKEGVALRATHTRGPQQAYWPGIGKLFQGGRLRPAWRAAGGKQRHAGRKGPREHAQPPSASSRMRTLSRNWLSPRSAFSRAS